MSEKQPSLKIAEIIPVGAVAIICGIGAISILFQYPVFACLLGAVGIMMGVAAMRIRVKG